MNIHLTHEIALSEEEFFKTFFDKEFNRKLYREYLAFPEFDVLDFEENEKSIRRKVRALPKLEMPGAVAKVLGGSFRYTEEGTFDRATKIWKWKTTPSLMSEKIKNEGTMRVEKIGDDKVRRIADIVLEAKVFGIGGMLEGTFEKAIRSGWEKSAEFMNKK